MRRTIARRLILFALVATIGFASRQFPLGNSIWDKSTADAAWAAAIFLIVGILLPIFGTIRLAIASMLIATAIEFFKLTDLPAQWHTSAISRLIFGTNFSWENLICYAIGISFIALLDMAFARLPK
jgi:hypothetical protein